MSVEESIVDLGAEFDRNVRVKLKNSGNEIIYVAQKPKKGVLLALHADIEQKGVRCERLSHKEHKHLEQWLIYYRLASWWSTLEVHSSRRDEIAKHYPNFVRKLLSIPTSNANAAFKVLRQIFGIELIDDRRVRALDEAGNPIACLVDEVQYGEFEKAPIKHTRFNKVQYENLVRLCVELSDRYYVAFRIEPTNSSKTSNIVFDYNFRQHFRIKRASLLGKSLSRRGGAPRHILLHAPLARMTDHYSIKIPAPDGYYVKAQSIYYSQPSAATKSGSVKNYKGRIEDQSDLIVSSKFWREVGGGTSAHLYLDQGSKVGSKIFAGLELKERPPGTEGRAYSVVRITLFAALMLGVWKYANPGAAPAAALLASLLTLGGLAVQAGEDGVPLFRAPPGPRSIIDLQAYLSIAFAIWLLSEQPLNYEFPNNWARFASFWHEWAGAILVLALAALTFVARKRLMKAHSEYENSVLLRKYDTPTNTVNIDDTTN